MSDHMKERPKTSPKDFFLHLLNIIMLYISAYSFGHLLFFLINYYFEDTLNPAGYGYSYGGSFESLRVAVSALIVAFPAYLIGARSLNKDYAQHPEKKNLRVKSWLEHLTVFGTALIILTTLMSVVYKFLSGEVTVRFILKVLTILYISGSIFTYYLLVVKRGIEGREKQVKIFAGVISLTILVAIGGAFYTSGSPKTERLRAFDRQRLDRLQSLVSNISFYYQRNQKLPEDLGSVQSVVGYPIDVMSPDTNEPVEYIKKGALNYQLCATFALAKEKRGSRATPVYPYPGTYSVYDRDYTAGKNCFDFTIRPEDYPPIKQ